MNAANRKKLAALVEQLEVIRSAVEDEKSDEEGKMDNLPDSFRDGEKGEKMQEAVDALDSAMDNLQSAIDDIQNIL